jgi:predicted metal-dependent HD superfamily phosphohydrolase
MNHFPGGGCHTGHMRQLSLWWPLEDHDALISELVAAYEDPQRFYHNTLHLTDVFDRLVDIAPTVRFDREPVLLAAWFHDAVYDGEPGAEERSAQWALAALPDHPWIGEVARLIRLTASHQPEFGDLNGAALTDADLGILAAAPPRYRAYAVAVRQEYAHVTDPDRTHGQTAALPH